MSPASTCRSTVDGQPGDCGSIRKRDQGFRGFRHRAVSFCREYVDDEADELDTSVNLLSVFPDSNPIERDRSETMVCTPLRMTPPANG
jgi:hypothetical protein